MGTLDRYLLREYVRVFLVMLVTVSAAMGISLLFAELDTLLKYSPGMLLSLKYILFYLPGTVLEIVPVIMLLAAFYFLHRLNSRNELVECFVSGMSPVRLMIPVLGMSLVISGLFFYFQERVVTRMTERAQDIMEIQIKGGQKLGRAETGNWLRGSQNRLYHVPLYDPEEQVLHGIWIAQFDPIKMKMLETFLAERAVYEEGVWVLENCTRLVYQGNKIILREQFEKKRMEIEEQPEDFAGVQLKPKEMGFFQLKKLVDNLGLSGGILRRYHAEMAFKLAVPLSCFVLTLVGMAWSLRPHFSGVSVELLGTILIGAGYVASSALFISLGGKGVLPPYLAGCASTIGFACLGLILTLRRQFFPFA